MIIGTLQLKIVAAIETYLVMGICYMNALVSQVHVKLNSQIYSRYYIIYIKIYVLSLEDQGVTLNDDLIKKKIKKTIIV